MFFRKQGFPGLDPLPPKLSPPVLTDPSFGGLLLVLLQGPDFGYITREILLAGASGLDAFGNLDVSPPVTVGGKEYPLGRVLIGSSFPK